MERKPYVLKNDEIETLIKGIMEYGDEETYARMLNKSLVTMQNIEDMDEMLMDMYETMLEKARSTKDEDKSSKELRLIYYQLASMFRILAHQIQREYIKKGQNKQGERFLRLVSYNKDIPSVS